MDGSRTRRRYRKFLFHSGTQKHVVSSDTLFKADRNRQIFQTHRLTQSTPALVIGLHLIESQITLSDMKNIEILRSRIFIMPVIIQRQPVEIPAQTIGCQIGFHTEIGNGISHTSPFFQKRIPVETRT